MYSFDTPESPGGLYVNLSTFQARRARARARQPRRASRGCERRE